MADDRRRKARKAISNMSEAEFDTLWWYLILERLV